MKLVAGRFADLRPFRLIVQMTIFAYPPIQLGVRRNILKVGYRPAPDNVDAVLNVLLVANVTVDFVVRALLPGRPRRGHQVA